MAKKDASKKQWTRAELERIRNTAEDLYINKGYSIAQLSQEWDISLATLSAWKKGRTGEKSWDERKAFILLAPNTLKERLYEHALAVAENRPSDLKADAISKIMKVIRELDKETSPRVVAAVFKNFDSWMASIEPETAILFTKYHKMFLQHIIEMES
jgi:transposase